MASAFSATDPSRRCRTGRPARRIRLHDEIRAPQALEGAVEGEGSGHLQRLFMEGAPNTHSMWVARPWSSPAPCQNSAMLQMATRQGPNETARRRFQPWRRSSPRGRPRTRYPATTSKKALVHLIRRIDHLPDRRREGEHRNHVLPGAPPGRRNRRVALTPAGLERLEPGRRRFGRLRPVDRPQIGHDLLAVLPGNEGQRVADRMRDTGLDPVQRPVLPLAHLLEHRVGHPSDFGRVLLTIPPCDPSERDFHRPFGGAGGQGLGISGDPVGAPVSPAFAGIGGVSALWFIAS